MPSILSLLACSEYNFFPVPPSSDAPQMSPDELDGVCTPSGEDHSPLSPDGSYAWEQSIDETRAKFRALVAGYGLDRETFTVMTVSEEYQYHDTFYKQGQILMVAGDERRALLDEYERSESDSFLENFYDTPLFPAGLPAVVCRTERSEDSDTFDLFLMTQFYVGNEIPVDWWGEGVADGLYANFLYDDRTAAEGDEQHYFMIVRGADGTDISEGWMSEREDDGRLGSALQRMEETSDNLNDLAEAVSLGWEEDYFSHYSYGLWLCRDGKCY